MAAELIAEWLVDYSCHKRMTSAIHVFSFEEMKEIAMQELIGGPSNVSVRFMLVTIETIMKQDDAKEYITALRLINDLYNATGERIPFRLYIKSITGLKILILFEMLKEGHKDVLTRLDQYFPPEGYSHPLAPARTIQTMTSAQHYFRNFFIPLTNEQDRRQEYFANGMKEDFGPNFFAKLKKHIDDVTKKVEEMLPDTMITKLLAQPDIIIKLQGDRSPLIKDFASILAEKESLTEEDIISIALAIKSYDENCRKNATSSHHAIDNNLMETTNADDCKVDTIAQSIERGNKYPTGTTLACSEDENANMVSPDTKSHAKEPTARVKLLATVKETTDAVTPNEHADQSSAPTGNLENHSVKEGTCSGSADNSIESIDSKDYECAKEEAYNASTDVSFDPLDSAVNVGEKRVNTVDNVSNSIEGSHSADKDGAAEYVHVCDADNSDKTQSNQGRTVEVKSCTNKELRQEGICSGNMDNSIESIDSRNNDRAREEDYNANTDVSFDTLDSASLDSTGQNKELRQEGTCSGNMDNSIESIDSRNNDRAREEDYNANTDVSFDTLDSASLDSTGQNKELRQKGTCSGNMDNSIESIDSRNNDRAREEDYNANTDVSFDSLDSAHLDGTGQSRTNSVLPVSISNCTDNDGAAEYVHVCAADNSVRTQTNYGRTIGGKSFTNRGLRQEHGAGETNAYTQLKDASSLPDKISKEKSYEMSTEEEDDGSDDNFGLDDISESFELQVYASGKKRSEKHNLITDVNNQIERTTSSAYNVKTDNETKKSTVKRKGTVSTNESPAKVSKHLGVPHRHLDKKDTLDPETVNKGSHLESSSSFREMAPPVITKRTPVNTSANSHLTPNDSASSSSSYSLNLEVDTHNVSSNSEEDFHTPSASPGQETRFSPTGCQQVEADSWKSGSENQSSLMFPSSFSIDEVDSVSEASNKSTSKSLPSCRRLEQMSGMHCLVPVYQFTNFTYNHQFYNIYK